MNPRLMVFAFLVGCSTTLALGQEQGGDRLYHEVRGQFFQGVDTLKFYREYLQRLTELGLTEAWLSKNSKDLFDIIEILNKGRDAEIKELEAAQAKMKSEDQIERRIALIKATLSEKADDTWLPSVFVDEAWLSKKSTDLLDIIKILYKGREADLKVLEDAQSAMSLEDQIEHRIALIKATLSEKTAKP